MAEKSRPVLDDALARAEILRTAAEKGLDLRGGRARRTSSRFCFGVEHGDYNGTELFGVGTDRFIWMGWKPNGTDRYRLFSTSFPGEGIVEFRSGGTPAPRSHGIADTWARFAFGVDWVLRREGLSPEAGFDAVLAANIPGGGMSRSASLTLNLMLTVLECSRLSLGKDEMRIIDLAQAVENDYIGSPCGKLDQIMIYFAKAGMGTHYIPATRTVRHIPFGGSASDFSIVSLDTGTVRPGLEKSTYRIRRAECGKLVEMASDRFGIRALAEVKEDGLYRKIMDAYGASHPGLCERLAYIFHAQRRFSVMLDAWEKGDIGTLGGVFRADGIGLRDLYRISGPEMETMCDIARTVPGVLGERMLGGGDKGAAGAIVRPASVGALLDAVKTAYPRSHPGLAEKYAVHECRVVDGVTEMAL
jgi:galactokinase